MTLRFLALLTLLTNVITTAFMLPPLPPRTPRWSTQSCNATPQQPKKSLWDRFTDAFQNDRDYDVKENPGISTRTPSAGTTSLTSSARVYPSLIVGTRWNVTISLCGISRNPDPSSDLFAAKVENGVPVSFVVTFVEDGRLAVDNADDDFTVPGAPGKWQLDADGTTLAMAVRCTGLERTIVTKGSLLQVYGGEDTQRTSSSYFVPEGSCLIQTSIIQNQSGRLIIAAAGGKVLGKDPRNSNGGKWSTNPEWSKTGSVVSIQRIE